jgi:pyruvyl transferase EpsO
MREASTSRWKGPRVNDSAVLATGHQSHAGTMAALSQRLDAIVALLPAHRRIVYLDIPDHGNVGDRLIHAGAEAFFARHRVQVGYRCTVYDFNAGYMARALGADTMIVLHGGGNFGTLWPRHQDFREHILRSYPSHRVVVLPQSVHFDRSETAAASAAAFRAHANLTICVRDLASEAAARNFCDHVLLMPDMAHALWGRFQPGPPTRPETLVIARTDHEAAQGAAVLATIEGRHTDWPSFLGAGDQRTVRLLRSLHRRIRRSAAAAFLPAPLSAGTLEGGLMIRRAVDLLAAHPMLVTDRLHGIILAALLGRPVRYLDNSYGKLSGYVESWLPGLDTVQPFTA